MVAQVGALVVLWAAFLALQLEKAKHGNCTLPFALVVGAQVVLLGAVTSGFVYYEVKAPTDNRRPQTISCSLRTGRSGRQPF